MLFHNFIDQPTALARRLPNNETEMEKSIRRRRNEEQPVRGSAKSFLILI
jgi:hypothetical protein